MLDERELADAAVALAQLDTKLLGQLHQLLAGSVQKLGIGRKRDVLGLDRGVDDDAGEIARLHRLGLDRHRQALLQERLQPLFSHSLAPACQRRAIEWQLVPEELFPTKMLEIRVLHPALAQDLIAYVIGVLEDSKTSHELRR